MRCGKAVSPSRQRAQASEAADVVSPAEDGGKGGGRSREGGSGGGAEGEAGIAMGGVRVVEYQRIDIIEQRPDARPSRVSLSLRCLLSGLLALPCCFLYTNSNPLNGRSRDLAYSILGLSLQTAAGCFMLCLASGESSSDTPSCIYPNSALVLGVCSIKKGRPPRLHVSTLHHYSTCLVSLP
jgi:hypothetical protein